MSLINQMLKDLETREQGERGLAELPASVRVVEETAPRISPAVLLVLAGLIAVALSAAWLFWGRHGPASAAPTVGTVKMVPTDEPPQPAPTAVTAAPRPPELPVQPTPAPIAPAQGEIAQPNAPGQESPATEANDGTTVPSKSAAVSRAASPVKPQKRARLGLRADFADEQPAVASASARSQQGVRVYGQGRRSTARENQERAALPDQENVEDRLQLARKRAALGDEEQALDLLQGLPSSDLDAGKLRAQLLLKLGRSRQAEQELLTLAAVDGGDPQVQGLLGALCQKQGRYDEAASHYGSALRSEPAQSRWWLGLGVSLEGAERYQEALEAYVRTSALGGLSREVQSYVAQRIDALRGQR